MSPTDPHPWTAVRYLTERLFQKMKEDFPRADMDYIFEESEKHCNEAWPKMTKEQKREYLELAANDKSMRDGIKSGIFKFYLKVKSLNIKTYCCLCTVGSLGLLERQQV